MGSHSNRGQLRPHFAGRSPPFLVAALCIGICILGVSYYSLSTQSSGLETKLALLVQKNHDLVSELEMSRSQLHVREGDFDQTKTELEKVKQDLQLCKDSIASKDKTIGELNSNNEQKKAELEECHKDAEKLKTESKKSVSDMRDEWEGKEAKWLKEKKDLQSEVERMRDEAKKKNVVPDEVSNNNGADDGKIDDLAKGGGDGTGKKDNNSKVIPVAAIPVADKPNPGPSLADSSLSLVKDKQKDEIGVLPEP